MTWSLSDKFGQQTSSGLLKLGFQCATEALVIQDSAKTTPFVSWKQIMPDIAGSGLKGKLQGSQHRMASNCLLDNDGISYLDKQIQPIYTVQKPSHQHSQLASLLLWLSKLIM